MTQEQFSLLMRTLFLIGEATILASRDPDGMRPEELGHLKEEFLQTVNATTLIVPLAGESPKTR